MSNAILAIQILLLAVFKESGERAKFHRNTGIYYIHLSLMTLKPGFTPMDI